MRALLAFCCLMTTQCDPPRSCYEGTANCRVVRRLCGNGRIDTADGEVCDTKGPLVDGATCAEFGMGPGVVGCRSDCKQFVTSGCSSAAPCDHVAGFSGGIACE